jgi:chromosome segregation ATPase
MKLRNLCSLHGLEIYENTLDNLIIKYMHKYGIDNVREGSFSGLILSKDQLKQINQIKDKLKESNLDQIDGFNDSVINVDDKEINLNLTTKYLNMDFIEKEIIKYKTELADVRAEFADVRAELADVKAELAKYKTRLVKPTSDLNNLDILD